MFGLVRRGKRVIKDKSVYMEVFGENRIAYRVITGLLEDSDSELQRTTYGIEAEDYRSGEKEIIVDFSGNIEDAVDFTEMLISKKAKPSQMYNMALNYLYVSIWNKNLLNL